MTPARPLEWLVEAITGKSGAEGEASLYLTGGPQLSARERLEIYRTGYLGRLVECLADDYPALRAALGEARFESLCHAYVERHPSSSPSLNAFGRHLPAFCRTTGCTLFHAELARLEWALVEVIHAALPPPLDLAALASIPPEVQGAIVLSPSEAVRLLVFESSVNERYGAWRRGAALDDSPQGPPSATLVHRRGIRLLRQDLEPGPARLLGLLLSGTPLGAALSRFAAEDSSGDAERRATELMREWVEAGLFAGAAVR